MTKEIFILGSGFSKAAYSKMPLLNELTKKVLKMIKDGDNCNYINSINLLKKVYTDSLNFKDFRCAAYSLAGIAENTRILG